MVEVSLRMKQVLTATKQLILKCTAWADEFFQNDVMGALDGREITEATFKDLKKAVTKQKAAAYATALMAAKNDIVLPEVNSQIGRAGTAKIWTELCDWYKVLSLEPDTGAYPLLGPEPHQVVDNFEHEAVATVLVPIEKCFEEGRIQLRRARARHFEVEVVFEDIAAVGHMVTGPKFTPPNREISNTKLTVKLVVQIILAAVDAEQLDQSRFWVSIDTVSESKEGMLLLDKYMAQSGQLLHYADYGPDSGGAKHSLEERPLFIPQEGYEAITESYIFVDTPNEKPKQATTGKEATDNIVAAITAYKK